MPSSQPDQRPTILHRVNLTLRGPVIDILAQLVPDVQKLPRDQALDLLLADLDLLARCFHAFKANPSHFQSLLVDQHKVPVEDAEALLECGRSLEQVVSMVVRTAAKRYFRKHLDSDHHPARQTNRTPRRGVLHRLRRMLTTMPQEKQPHPLTRGEMLYQEFQDYLRHDWQVPMLHEYSQLSPGVVRKLGARILDYRLPEDIRRLRADPDHPPAPTPLVTTTLEEAAGYTQPSVKAEERSSEGMAKAPQQDQVTLQDCRARLADILTPDGSRLRAEPMTPYLLDPNIRKLIPKIEHSLRLNPILNRINGDAVRILVNELAFRIDQLAVFLMTAYGLMGDENFFVVFGIPGRSDAVNRLVDRAKGLCIGHSSSLEEIADFIKGVVK